MEQVRLSRRGHVAVLTMTASAKRNVLGRTMLSNLTCALATVQDARAVVLRGEADAPVWCAGFDIDSLGPGIDPLAHDGALQRLFRAVRDHPSPVIAMLHGSAWGGGSDLALRCDLQVADPTFTLAFTPARLGLPYDSDGLLNMLLRAGLNVAIKLFTTADPTSAERAYQLGLVNHLVPETELETFTMALAERIAANAPLSVQSAKQQLRALAEALPLAPAIAAALHAGRRRALDSEDYANGLEAFHARVSPEFKGR